MEGAAVNPATDTVVQEIIGNHLGNDKICPKYFPAPYTQTVVNAFVANRWVLVVIVNKFAKILPPGVAITPASSGRQSEDPELEQKEFEDLVSINYADIALSNEFIKEKSLLLRAVNAYESRLLKFLNREEEGNADESAQKSVHYETFCRLGHVNLLAVDYARALSAFQHAYKIDADSFWQDSSNLYGLGICYFHFRIYRAATVLFNQFLYCYPYSPRATEVHIRLGIANKLVGDYQQAYRHLRVALNDRKECKVFPRYLIRFHIAHCFDSFGDFVRAKEEYKRLLDLKILPDDISAAAYRQLGWISFRSSADRPDKERALHEAEDLIKRALERQRAGRTFCYLGRVVSQLPKQENAAFDNFRHAIDSHDADANSAWFGIGELYVQQNQPLDALQAFACAVQLDRNHIGAWASLGRLYEAHRQFQHALHCYREAVSNAKAPTEWLNQRIRILEKELRVAAHLQQQRVASAAAAASQSNSGGASTPTNTSSSQTPTIGTPQQRPRKETISGTPIAGPQSSPHLSQLPGPEHCWSLNIPLQVSQRQSKTLKQHKNTYRAGSAFWQMNELAAQFQREPLDALSLNDVQRQILDILKVNENVLKETELKLLKQLEERSGGRPLSENKAPKRPIAAIEPNAVAGVAADPNTHRPVKAEGGMMFLSEDDVTNVLADLDPTAAAAVAASEDAAAPAHHDPMEEEHEALTPPSDHDEALVPPAFSLLSALKVPITIAAAEVLELCNKRKDQKQREHKLHSDLENQETEPLSEEPIMVFEERPAPPRPPVPPKTSPHTNLHPQVPVISVDSPREANSIELQNFCYNSNIALVRGLTHALRVDLSQFSTKTLIETAQTHEVEVRTQLKMPGDANLDNLGNPTWACYSAKSFTTVTRYGQYQAESFRHSMKEETEKLRNATKPTPAYQQRQSNGEPAPKRRKAAAAAVVAEAEAAANQIPTKIIKFGTNVDLSDESLFKEQMKELRKMPAFCRLQSASNLLTYLDYTVLGMNTVQLYMKVPGCRTPGHLENNNFASVNVNIGPGECEWFGVAYEYYPLIDKMCRERNLDFLKGAWWPDYDDLIKAGIPVYRFTQKAGDLVWVGGGCVHWVQATGWCNNIAWNVGPCTANQMQMAVHAHEWNRLNTYRSLVPLQHLCWQLARSMRFTDQKIFNLVKGILIRSLSYSKMVTDYVDSVAKSKIKYQSRQKHEIAHYCYLCEIEVFNVLFVKEIANKFRVFCLQCARRGSIDEYVVLQQCSYSDLSTVFDQFQLHPQNKTNLIC